MCEYHCTLTCADNNFIVSDYYTLETLSDLLQRKSWLYLLFSYNQVMPTFMERACSQKCLFNRVNLFCPVSSIQVVDKDFFLSWLSSSPNNSQQRVIIFWKRCLSFLWSISEFLRSSGFLCFNSLLDNLMFFFFYGRDVFSSSSSS